MMENGREAPLEAQQGDWAVDSVDEPFCEYNIKEVPEVFLPKNPDDAQSVRAWLEATRLPQSALREFSDALPSISEYFKADLMGPNEPDLEELLKLLQKFPIGTPIKRIALLILVLTSLEKFKNIRMGRREFMKALLALSPAVLSGCNFDQSPHSPDDHPAETFGGELIQERLDWETPEVIATAAMIAGLDPELTGTLIANGFKSKAEFVGLIPEEPELVWYMVKLPGGGFRTAVLYCPEKQEWLKVLFHPTREVRFIESVEAMRVSARLSGVGADVVPIEVTINGVKHKAMRMKHIGPSLNSLWKSEKINPTQLAKAYEQAYTRALELANEGYLFADPNLDNVLVLFDESGNIRDVVLIDFSNRRVRVRVTPNIIESIRAGFTKHANRVGIQLDFSRAEQMANISIDYADEVVEVTGFIGDSQRVVVEEIRPINPGSGAIRVADDAATAEVISARPDQSILVRISRNPWVRKGAKVLGVVGNMLLIYEVVNMLDGPEASHLEAMQITIKPNQEEYPLDPEGIFNWVMNYKGKFRTFHMPGYQQWIEAEQLYINELRSLNIDEATIWEMIKSRPEEFSNMSTMPVRLNVAGPQFNDSSRKTNVMFSAMKDENGTRMVVVWRESGDQSTPSEMILAIQSKVNEPWQLVQQSGNPTMFVPGTNQSGEETGYIIFDEYHRFLTLVIPDLVPGN